MLRLDNMVKGHSGAWYFAPGLFLIGLGLGVMLTPSVNVVQSAFPENLQGEISGLSRSVSNLGSSFGTAIAGTILVAGLADPNRSYGIAMIVLAFFGLMGLGATVLLPAASPWPGSSAPGSRRRPPIGANRSRTPRQPVATPNDGSGAPAAAHAVTFGDWTGRCHARPVPNACRKSITTAHTEPQRDPRPNRRAGCSCTLVRVAS